MEQARLVAEEQTLKDTEESKPDLRPRNRNKHARRLRGKQDLGLRMWRGISSGLPASDAGAAARSTISLLNVAIGTNTDVRGGIKTI
jgi:hypothetical protein